VEVRVAVEGVGVGVDSPTEMSQDHYLSRVVKLGPVRTLKEMCLLLDLATKEKMATKQVINSRQIILNNSIVPAKVKSQNKN